MYVLYCLELYDEGLADNAGFPFSAKNKDVDGYSDMDCAELTNSGWWHKPPRCTYVNLNGKYVTPGKPHPEFRDVFHVEFNGYESHLKATKMMFRRTQ